MKVRHVLISVALSLAVAGCTSTPSSHTTTTTKAPARQTTTTTATIATTTTTLAPTTTTAAPPTTTTVPPTTAAATSCTPLTNGGNCYEPGQYCRNSDHGATGVAGNGTRIQCLDNNGWRWEPI